MTNLELMDSIIKFRKSDNTFQRSIDERNEKMAFRFFDGPPFASGTPHYWHLLAGAIKDLIPRYMTMRGYQVKRKRGWDCHGLPVEKAVEKALGIDGKRDIETKIWIESFVEKCRAYVNDTNEIWKRFIDHTARRADVDNEYRTMDLDFMESVIYCFDKIYKDNLVYKGFKVQRYCPSCATPLANNEVSEGYEDKTDTAITVKFQLNPMITQAERGEKFELTEDGVGQYVRAIIKNDKGDILQIFNTQKHKFEAPGGKVDKGEDAEQAVARELREEIGVEIQEVHYLGSFKEIVGGLCLLQHTYEVKIVEEPQIQEAGTHSQLVRVGIEPSENELGFGVRIEGNIIEEPEELMSQFWNIYTYVKEIPQKISLSFWVEAEGWNEESRTTNTLASSLRSEWRVYFLARTTTPRTLPSNMFLATGADIQYSMLYDFASKEYYILATNLIKKYYKNPEDYLTIRTFKGKELQGLHYKPLFDYIVKSNIKEAYTSDFFQVLNPDFVSTEDGTGIVHIAPTFGEEDFNAVAKLLGAKNALEWLFMPVNEYGEFDEQIYDYTGESVLNINKTIIERLKEERKLIKSENITHSYPHCRRCHTPLISKAMSSWFIKEQEMNAQTWKDAEKMNFVPESVKNRFVNGLQQAPDWNIARNRYRGSPLPIWQNVEDENDHFSVGTLEGIYQLSRSGSKNITKHILIRHAQTDYNLEKKFDILGKARCTETGRLQAEAIKDQLIGQNIHQDKDLVIVISPLERTWETILPFLKEVYSETELAESYKNYEEVKKQYEEVYHAGNLHSYVQDSQVQQHFEIGRNLFVDFRVTDTISPKAQDTVSDISLHLASIEEFCHHDETGETLKQKIERCKEYMYDLNKKYPTKTVITVSHGGSLASMKIAFRAFDYLKDGHKNTPNNAEFSVHYRDNARNTEVDLHKPYVDSYRFMKDGKTYKRIPEVMDCWFESGSMPFGQEHYVGQDEVKLDSSVCKLSLMRHGQSINNKKRAEGTLEGYDYRDDTNELSEKGKLQAKNNINKIEKEVKKADSVFYISLLSRAVQTIEPYFEKTFGWKLTQHPVYLETKKRFDEAMKHGTFRWQDFIEIEVEKNIYLDARVMERHIDSNDMEYIQRVNNHEPQRNEIEDRATNFLKGIKKHAGKQVIVATHRFFIFQCKRYFDGTNYQLHEDPTKTEVSIHNGELYNFYLDVGTGKPREEKNQTFTADFIAEGLDQTRGRFRSLHVLGHAIKGGNAMKNVVVNGMILAEDGKKMSKSLRNYPDPQQLIEKRGGDSFRLHVLSAPVVRAEPMRFSEKGTEQAFKDFTLPLQNVFNFFETYAKIDNWKSDGTEVYFSTPFTKEGEGDSNAELILRINPDLIISWNTLILQETAESIQRILYDYTHKEIEILSQQPDHYFDLLQQYKGKKILIVSDEGTFGKLRHQLYPNQSTSPTSHQNEDKPPYKGGQREVIELPIYVLSNDLDKWILAELNKTLIEVDGHLQNYLLDEATKSAMDFMDKLTNRRLRRSRRRFRANGMNEDKSAAYATLYHVLKRYLQILAPFTPFITEYLWLQLADFTETSTERDLTAKTPSSIHLTSRPIANEHYLNETLIEETETVRKIIKLALFIRAKNKIAVKQPLQKLKIKID